MTAALALAQGRVLAESLMVDACTVQRRTGVNTDDLTGDETPTLAPVYTGKCKVQTAGTGAMGDRTDVAEVSTVVLRIELHLPVVGSELVVRGDLVTITAASLDAALVGRRFTVRDLMHKTFETARRLTIEEVS